MKRNVTLFALPLVLMLSGYFTEAFAEQRLGRLFYTPDQRVAMERTVIDHHTDRDRAPAISFDGQIRRSDGKTVTWINGEISSEKPVDPPSKLTTLHRERALKVGETLDLGSGTVNGPLEGGSLVINRAPSRQ